MRPGSTVIPATSITSALDGHVAAAPVVTVSMRPSVMMIVASRTGARPVPSISVPPRRMSMDDLLAVRIASGVYAAAASRAAAQPRVERVAQPVADEIEREHGQH